ncbi:MAG: hypothetical protein KIT89_01360 [Microcella sp.]|uniref:hypothetical protein n=1 Tax=Microcella sp. TaxID=1913979 RepID=UPI0024C87BFD|nr:hypothetical protein [Microcella sp.]UYN83912.1 MAG: hypothetical protein KIT89_01360 [Microcella sp.]
MNGLRAVFTLGSVVVMLLTAGCSADGPPAAQPSLTAAPQSIDEASATAELYRSRIDPARNGMQVSVTNTSAAPLTIVRTELRSPALAEPIVRDRTSVIAAGATRDLAVELTTPQCPELVGQQAAPLPTVVLTIALATGETAELMITATDRLGQWNDWHARACFTAAVAERVDLTVRRAPERDDLAARTLGLDLIASNVRADLALETVHDTVLFALVDASESRATSIALDEELTAGASTVIELSLSPARCDPHAIAEDKQGTLFIVTLAVGTVVGSTTVAADDRTRSELYDAFAAICRF